MSFLTFFIWTSPPLKKKPVHSSAVYVCIGLSSAVFFLNTTAIRIPWCGNFEGYERAAFFCILFWTWGKLELFKSSALNPLVFGDTRQARLHDSFLFNPKSGQKPRGETIRMDPRLNSDSLKFFHFEKRGLGRALCALGVFCCDREEIWFRLTSSSPRHHRSSPFVSWQVRSSSFKERGVHVFLYTSWSVLVSRENSHVTVN